MEMKSNLNIFIVNQNEQSKYNDIEGIEYEFPTKIPNGKTIKEGDLLIFNFSKKEAIRLNLNNATISGIARVDKIIYFRKNEVNMARATYSWYKKFVKNISFELIGGDLRNNKNNSINKIPFELNFNMIIELLKIH